MADSFFGFDASVSNLNDDDGGGGDGSEEEYDALNDETFGQADSYDWESQHEHLAEQLESSRKSKNSYDDSHSQLEASLSQLVLDEPDAPHHSTLNTSNVWQHDAPFGYMPAPQPKLKNVLSVEELERRLRQKPQQPPQPPQPQPPPHPQMNQFFQPRFPPVILQRPPGLQAPAPLPFAPPATAPTAQGGSQMAMNRINYYPPQQNNQLVNGQQQHQQQQHHPHQQQQHPQQQQQQQYGGYQQLVGAPRLLGAPPGLPPPRAGFPPHPGQMPFNNHFRPPPKMDQQPQMNQNVYNQQMMPQQQQQQMQQQQQHQMQQQHLQQHQQQMQNQQQHNMQSQQMKMSPKSVQNQKITQNPNQNQKNRVIYNSNQKNQNLTSQNLVQLIQNTHPMLQFNNINSLNSYHNANHHPMLNRNGVFNPQINPMMLMHRMPNGNYNNNNVNNRHMTNGDESYDQYESGNQSDDEYAGLMTSREKQWLLNIQMLQLNTGTPYIDDFYYTVFLERQSRKEKEGVKEAHKANQQNHPFYSGNVRQEQNHRERHNSNRHNSASEDAPPRTYVPTQFENSLGRLQCGSVTAPRKIIDVELVSGEGPEGGANRPPSRASTAAHSEYPREVRRTKQILLDIEALYLILLRLEELNEPLAISNALILKEREEKQKLLDAAQKEMDALEADTNVFLRNIEACHRKSKNGSPKTDAVDKRQVVNLTVTQNPTLTAKNLLDENKDELINRMFAGLLHEDRLQQFMMVRKGKRLVSRFLRRAGPAHARLRGVWARVLRALAGAARRDDGELTPLADAYHEYIAASSGWAAILESSSLLGEAFDPARTPYALTAPFTISCICALIEKVTTLINTPEATPNERQWTKFLKTFARAIKKTTLTVAKPVRPLPETKLVYHIKQIESRSVIEILQRGKTTAEYDLSKTEFSELLIRHLC